MKKYFVFFAYLLAFLAVSFPASANPLPQNTPAPSLISYGATGEMVVRIQLRLRELGYLNYKPTGNFQTMSVAATKSFQSDQTDSDGLPIYIDGTVGPQSESILFNSLFAKRTDIAARMPIGTQVSNGNTAAGTPVSWSEIKNELVIGDKYLITDYNDGKEFSIIFTGGSGHAEVECSDPQSSATFLELFGGEYNYSKRPVIITIGERRIAASLKGFPHGSDEVDGNEMQGHACLFFFESISHVGKLPDVEHNNHIQKAAGR